MKKEKEDLFNALLLDLHGTGWYDFVLEMSEDLLDAEFENKRLRNQLKVAVKQGMDGAKTGYEEVIERQKTCIKGLLYSLQWLVDLHDGIYKSEDPWEVLEWEHAYAHAVEQMQQVKEMLGIKDESNDKAG